VVEKHKLFKVPNINSSEANFKKLIFEINDEIFFGSKKVSTKKNYLCVCSGGTTSSCAKDGLITLDLRRYFNSIIFKKNTGVVKIGGGVLMGDLSYYLDQNNRTFPTGLSGIPGVGYLLTGGISPLSRRYGLAIDNIESVSGFFGNGKSFKLVKNQLNENEFGIWDGIRGAAPFFSIVTELELKTFKSYPIMVFEGFVKDRELADLILLSENFPENFSLQYMLAKDIYVYIVAEMKTDNDKKVIAKYEQSLKLFPSLLNKTYSSFNRIKFFPKELELFESNSTYHSEVLSLLGKDLGSNVYQFVKDLKLINKNKPNKSCYFAAQQLGGESKNIQNSGLFIHRESTWKPWIFASWDKSNKTEKKIVIQWMLDSWEQLKKYYPKIHLAQLHNHLDSHTEELNLAFSEKLNDLKNLKNLYDPFGNLPHL